MDMTQPLSENMELVRAVAEYAELPIPYLMFGILGFLFFFLISITKGFRFAFDGHLFLLAMISGAALFILSALTPFPIGIAVLVTGATVCFAAGWLAYALLYVLLYLLSVLIDMIRAARAKRRANAAVSSPEGQ